MLEENKALVSRFVDEVQSQHKIDALGEFFVPNVVRHTSALSGAPAGIEGIKQVFLTLFAAFPDIHATIHDQIAEGDKVVTRKTFHATHRGVYQGIPPTGKQVTFDVIDIYRIAGGRMTDHWAVGDFLGLMQQIGAVPALRKE